MVLKIRDDSNMTVSVVAFAEHRMWLEEQARLFHDQVVRIGPLTSKENS